jgi:poly-gamma-glutamate synthesis protein (capsule biosynthesis protein)
MIAATAGPAWARETIRVAFLGQSLVQHDRCAAGWPGMAGIKARLHRSQVVFTDLETAISGPRAGKPTRDTNVLHVADPAVIDCLTGLGVNLFATSNNHAWDLGSGGILTALDALDQRRLAHAGSGANLAAASAPGFVRAGGTEIALVAAAAGAIHDGAAATPNRPGVNELRRRPDGALDAADVARTLDAIRSAKRQGAIPVAYLHNHYWEADPATTPGWQRDYARRCVDAGAAAFVAHGPPLLQGIERYRGAPLFHGLGSFIFQTRKPEGSYGPATWQSLIVEAEFANGAFTGARLVPLQLDASRASDDPAAPVRGTPAIARGNAADTILETVDRLSRALGYRIARGKDSASI